MSMPSIHLSLSPGVVHPKELNGRMERMKDYYL
jgi:hypothetical protein